MTIEVRQLLIKSQVNTAPVPGHAPAPWTEQAREQVKEEVKEEILAECKTWLAQRLQDAHER